MGAHIKWITASYTGDDFPSIKFSLTLSKFEAFIYSAPNTYTLIFGRYHRTYMIMGRMRWWYAIPLLLILSVDAVSHAIRVLFYQNAQMLKCSNAHARMLGWMCTFELQKHQNYSTLIQRNRWQSQEMAFEQTLLFHYVQSAKISRKWNGGIKGGSERQWINASKNIAMNVSTNDSCRSCTKYKQCLINCYWMVNWIFKPRELVMPAWIYAGKHFKPKGLLLNYE